MAKVKLADLFDCAFGTADLNWNGKSTKVRLVFDPKSNNLLCSRATDPEKMYELFDQTVFLTNVQLHGNGIEWFAKEISNFRISSSGGGTWSTSHSIPGLVGGHSSSKELIKLSKNEYFEFELSKNLGEHWEFAGGYDISGSVDLKPKLTYMGSSDKLTWISGSKPCPLSVRELCVAVGVSVGYPVSPRMHISENRLKLFPGQSIPEENGTPFFDCTRVMRMRTPETRKLVRMVNFETVRRSAAMSFLRTSALLYKNETSERLCNQIQLYLHAKIMKGLTENKVMAFFQFIEAVDGKKQLERSSTSRLLGISEANAQKFINVRHQVAHATMTLEEASRRFMDFGDPEIAKYAYRNESVPEFASSLNFLGFIESKSNELVAKIIGFRGPIDNKFEDPNGGFN